MSANKPNNINDRADHSPVMISSASPSPATVKNRMNLNIQQEKMIKMT